MSVDDKPDWVQQLLEGDEQAAVDFWQQFGERLQRVAEARISPGLQQRVGADDIVQSVCRTFFRRAQEGQFDLPDSESLWRLLCTITVMKVRKHARFHSRKKRGMQQEQGLSGEAAEAMMPEQDGPTPEQSAMLVDQLEQLLAGLEEEERRIVDLKLQSFTNHEVAERLACSERTVRRMLKRVQSRMQRILDEAKAEV